MTTNFDDLRERSDPSYQIICMPPEEEQDILAYSPSPYYYLGFTEPSGMIDLAGLATKAAFARYRPSESTSDWWGRCKGEVFSQASFAQEEIINSTRVVVHELEQRFEELSFEMHTLAGKIGRSEADSDCRARTLLQQPDIKAMLGDEMVGDDWVDFFDYIADGCEAHRPDLSQLSTDALHSPDQAVRSAAARALALVNPQDAARLLPELLSKERNRYVRAAFVSAIESAAL